MCPLVSVRPVYLSVHDFVPRFWCIIKSFSVLRTGRDRDRFPLNFSPIYMSHRPVLNSILPIHPREYDHRNIMSTTLRGLLSRIVNIKSRCHNSRLNLCRFDFCLSDKTNNYYIYILIAVTLDFVLRWILYSNFPKLTNLCLLSLPLFLSKQKSTRKKGWIRKQGSHLFETFENMIL